MEKSSSIPEKPFQELLKLRNELIDFKNNRTSYIRSNDVIQAHDRLCNILKYQDDDKANTIESHDVLKGGVLDDCLQLISLLYLTVGRNNEPPAIRNLANTAKRLLDHLAESGNYSIKDIAPIPLALKKFCTILEREHPSSNPSVIKFLQAKLCECSDALKPLEEHLEKISPGLINVHEKLVSLRRCIKSAEARQKFSLSEIERYLQDIRSIEAQRINGKIASEDGSAPDEGQELLESLLENCFVTAGDAIKGKGAISPAFSDVSDRLLKIKSKLERLEMTQAWSLRESDLYELQAELVDIDNQRVNGRFVGSGRQTTEEGQTILLYLLRRSYAHIYSLVSSSEPVSEALTPIFNQLQTVQRCLKEVQKFGIQDARDLYPYSMKLASIDNLRVDGKFMVGSDVPEGQGRVVSLLAECFEICQELRTTSPSRTLYI